jgi:hypothetical protein
MWMASRVELELSETWAIWKHMHLRMKVVEFVETLSLIEEFWIAVNTGFAIHALTTGLPSLIAAPFAKVNFSI